jgi:hypothetical protein
MIASASCTVCGWWFKWGEVGEARQGSVRLDYLARRFMFCCFSDMSRSLSLHISVSFIYAPTSQTLSSYVSCISTFLTLPMAGLWVPLFVDSRRELQDPDDVRVLGKLSCLPPLRHLTLPRTYTRQGRE